MLKRHLTILFIVLLLSFSLPVSTDSKGNVLVPEIEIAINPGYVVLDVGPGENPTAQVSCTLSNPSLHQVTASATITVAGFMVTPQTFMVTLASGGDITMPIAVAGEPRMEPARAIATVVVEIERQDGVGAVFTKTRFASFIIAAPPYARFAVFPRELHVPDKGWYQPELEVTNNGSSCQFYDVTVETDSPKFRVEATTSRIYVEAGEVFRYPVNVWCSDKDASGEMQISFTPDYGKPEVKRIALNKGDWELEEMAEVKKPVSDGNQLDPGSLSLIAVMVVAILLVRFHDPSPGRTKSRALLLSLLLLVAPCINEFSSEAKAVSVSVEAQGLELNRDQLFYSFSVLLENDEAWEQTYRIQIAGTGGLIFAYSQEVLVPTGETAMVPVIMMKDYYQPPGILDVTIYIEVIENEGLEVTGVPLQISYGFQLLSKGDDLFHGTLDPEIYVRESSNEESRTITVNLESAITEPKLILFKEDKGSLDLEQLVELEEADSGSFTCLLEGRDVEKDVPYRLQLFSNANDSEPAQEITIIFADERGDDDGILPGFHVLGLLAALGICSAWQIARHSGRKRDEL